MDGCRTIDEQIEPAFTDSVWRTLLHWRQRRSRSDRSFDIEYWQRQGDAAIFRAAWELVESYCRDRGMNPDELRLQRSVEAFQRP